MSLESECGQKKRYFTRKFARRRARATSPDGVLHAYRCPHCGFWHVGHKYPAAKAAA